MIRKSFVIPVLLVGMVLLGVVGCGEDLKTPEELEREKAEALAGESSVSALANEELYGSWEIVSIFGMTLEEYLESLVEGGEVEEKVKRFDYVFAPDNVWTCNLVSETTMIFPDMPPGKTETIGTWSGTYIFDGLTLSLFTKESEVHIIPEPKDFFQIAFDLTLAEAAQDYDDAFRSDFINPFARSACTKQGDTLVLVIPFGEEMVLEKQ